MGRWLVTLWPADGSLSCLRAVSFFRLHRSSPSWRSASPRSAAVVSSSTSSSTRLALTSRLVVCGFESFPRPFHHPFSPPSATAVVSASCSPSTRTSRSPRRSTPRPTTSGGTVPTAAPSSRTLSAATRTTPASATSPTSSPTTTARPGRARPRAGTWCDTTRSSSPPTCCKQAFALYHSGDGPLAPGDLEAGRCRNGSLQPPTVPWR